MVSVMCGGWQLQWTSPNNLAETFPDKISVGSYEKMAFLLVLKSLCIDLQNSNSKLFILIFFKNCSMVVPKLHHLIENRDNLIQI